MRRFLSVIFLLLFALPAQAQEAQHALALHGSPKYPANFGHFDYVNPKAVKGGDVRLAVVGTFDNLNPYILKGVAASGLNLTYDTLLEQSSDEPFSAYAALASGVTIAADKLSVTFTLRPEARWHDGQPITSEDVVWSFNTLLSEGHPMYRAYYADIAKVEALNAQTVRFSFKTAANRELPLIAGQMAVLPKHYWATRKFGETTLEPPLGSGPYKISSIDAGRRIVYQRVENYWGQNLAVHRGQYNYSSISFEYYRDATVALEAFLAGRYDFRLENSAKNWATAYETDAVKNGQIIKAVIKNEDPAGMQGFAFNTRRPYFADRRVRQALGLMFDFEWSNRNLAYNAYTRSNSFFSNSDLAAMGLPQGAELALLEPFRANLPPELFSQEYKPPVTDGSGNIRAQLREAHALLEAAGFKLKDGVRLTPKGEIFAFDILEYNPQLERWVLPFIRNLERLGIKANYRLVDPAQYQARMAEFNFDMTTTVLPQSRSPGNEQRDYWHSSKAQEKGSRNIMGISDPTIDALTDKVVQAQSREELLAATQALDRVLLWGHYIIPHFYIGSYRVAYWDIFNRPEIAPKYDVGMLNTWWIDAAKAAKLAQSRKQQP